MDSFHLHGDVKGCEYVHRMKHDCPYRPIRQKHCVPGLRSGICKSMSTHNTELLIMMQSNASLPQMCQHWAQQFYSPFSTSHLSLSGPSYLPPAQIICPGCIHSSFCKDPPIVRFRLPSLLLVAVRSRGSLQDISFSLSLKIKAVSMLV